MNAAPAADNGSVPAVPDGFTPKFVIDAAAGP